MLSWWLEMELTEFGSIAHIKKGKKPLRQVKKPQDGFMPYVDIEAFETGNIKAYTDGEKCLPCCSGEILIVCDGSRSGFVGRAIDGYVGSTLAIISADGMCKDYLYYFLQGKYALLNTKKRGTGTPHLDQQTLFSQRLVVPSVQEQNRIVARIEELFSQLDSGVETLKTVKLQLAVYRQAVVKDVFRYYNGNAGSVQIKDVCNDIKVGIVIKPTQYYVKSGGIHAFRNANIRRNYIDDSDWAMISMAGHKQNPRSEVHTDDVLIARSGVNLGMAAAVPEKFNGYNAIDVVIAVPKREKVLSKYLAYYTNSPYGIYSVKRNQRGVAQGHLNVTVYGKLPIILPSIEVQEKIISEIDLRLSVCDSIEKTVDTALHQAKAMRQSILKQAFEGRI